MKRAAEILLSMIMSMNPMNASSAEDQKMMLNQQQTQTIKLKMNTLQQQSESWGLSQEEYLHYQEFMAGPRGIQSPGLDPLTALGIEARTDAERRRFAELWVKHEFTRTEKELQFQREVDAAWKRLFPDVMPVNMGKAIPERRLAVFVKSTDCSLCESRLQKLLAAGRELDIYLVDSNGDDAKLRQWAKDHLIPVDKVRSRQITLNHDGGRWIRFGSGLMPVVLQQESDGWRIVTP